MNKLLIRAEDKNRWESRAPLVPEDLKKIVAKTDANVFIEQSSKRYAKEADYITAGASVCIDMSQADVILGIKEIPVEKILNNKTYLFFSHTIKGQKSNMGMLQKIIDSGSTLIDYEKIVNDKNQRLIFFGPYAGSAGAIDILSILGERWKDQGFDTPFKNIKPSHRYSSLSKALEQVQAAGDEIQANGLPADIGPFTIGLLGYGNVSKGAQQVFNCLPIELMSPDEMKRKLAGRELDSKTIFMTIFKEQDLVKPITGTGQFTLQEYYDFPERYESCFEQYLDCFTLLVNAVFWTNRYPRFITWDNLYRLDTSEEKRKLEAIADISCDVEGAVECTVKTTDSDSPAYRVDPKNRVIHDGYLGDGIALLAVDNLPSELPHDSSTFFSNQLAPFIPNLLEANYTSTLETSNLAPELKRATIVYNGELTDDYRYLQDHLDQWRGV